MKALGYALKNADTGELGGAIRAVATGRQYLCSGLSLTLLRKVLPPPKKAPAPLPQNPYNFSRRETEVLQLFVEGLTTSKIAEQLPTSKRTIETHRQHTLEKAGPKTPRRSAGWRWRRACCTKPGHYLCG